MNFDQSDIQKMLLDSAERLMATRTSVEMWRERRALPDGLDHAAWNQFADLGWLALPIPEDAGGLGGSMEDVALLMVVLGKALAVEPYVSSAVLGAHIVDRAGAEGREALLGLVATGEVRLALAHDEAGDRYSVEAPRTAAAKVSDSGFLLNGSKMLALDAPSATHLIVSAALEDATTGLFLIESNADGVTIERYPLIDGSMAADISLKAVQLPSNRLIAQGEAAIALLSEAIDRATIALVAQAVGSMEACLELCSSYVKERRQFNQPIGKFQVLQHLMVDMLVATHQARSALYQALAKIESPADDRARAVSAAKIVSGEAMQCVSRTGIQLHGGYGVTDEYAISHHFRRLLVLEKAFGDIDHHVRRLGSARPQPVS